MAGNCKKGVRISVISLSVHSFFKYYIFHPFHSELTKKRQAAAFISSLALGILSMGTAPLIVRLLIYKKNWTRRTVPIEVEREPEIPKIAKSVKIIENSNSEHDIPSPSDILLLEFEDDFEEAINESKIKNGELNPQQIYYLNDCLEATLSYFEANLQDFNVSTFRQRWVYEIGLKNQQFDKIDRENFFETFEGLQPVMSDSEFQELKSGFISIYYRSGELRKFRTRFFEPFSTIETIISILCRNKSFFSKIEELVRSSKKEQ